MADRYLDKTWAAYENSLKKLREAENARENEENELARLYSEASLTNPTLPLPSQNAEGQAVYKGVTRKLLNDLAKKGYTNANQIRQAIESNPLLNKLVSSGSGIKEAAINSVLQRSSELLNDDHITFNSLLDEDPSAQVPGRTINESVADDSLLSRGVQSAWEVTKDIGHTLDWGASKLLGVNVLDRTTIGNKKADLADKMSDLGQDTTTGMSKMYTLRELQRRKAELEKVNGMSGRNASRDNELQIINSKIRGISASFSNAELAAINKNGKLYDSLKQERDDLNRIDPSNWDRYTEMDAFYDRQAKELEFEQQAFRGNADIFNWDNVGYDWKLLKSKFTPDQMAEFGGMMVPWIVGGEWLGGMKIAGIAGKGLMGALKGVGKSVMGMGTTGESRVAIANAFKEIGKTLSTKSGLAQTITSGAAYSSAAAKTSADWLNEYFDREGTVEGFNKIEAGLFGMLEHFANFYGGKLSGEIAGKYSKAAVEKLMGTEISNSLTAAKKFIGLGNDGALANAAITQIMSKFKNPLAWIDSLAEKAATKAELMGSEASLLGKASAGLTKKALEGTSLALKGAKAAIANPSGLSATAAIKAGASLAMDNMAASIAHQMGQQKKEGIDWNEVGKAGIEGIAAGIAGHGVSLGGQYAKNVVQNAVNRPNGYYDPINVRKQKLETLESDKYRGTAEAISTYHDDILTLNHSADKLEKELDEKQKEITEELQPYVNESEGKLVLTEEPPKKSAEHKVWEKAKKKVNEYNHLTELLAETNKRKDEDETNLIQHAKEYAAKNPDADFVNDKYLDLLLDNLDNSKVENTEEDRTARNKNLGKDAAIDIMRQIRPEMSQEELEREYEAREGKVHTGEEVFKNKHVTKQTKNANESDEEFNKRTKDESDSYKKKAMAMAHAIGRSGRDLSDLESNEIQNLAEGKWTDLQKSLETRAKKAETDNTGLEKAAEQLRTDKKKLESITEDKRTDAEKKQLEDTSKKLEETEKQIKENTRLSKSLEKIGKKYNEEAFKKNRSEINDKVHTSTDELDVHGYTPTEQSVNEQSAKKFSKEEGEVDINDLKDAYNKQLTEEEFVAKAIEKKQEALKKDTTGKTDAQKNQEIEDAGTRARTLYDTYRNQIKESIAAHNALLKGGTKPVTMEQADIDRVRDEFTKNNKGVAPTESELKDAVNKEAIKKVNEQLEKLDKENPGAGLKDTYEAKSVTYYENGKRVTKGYVQRKTSTRQETLTTLKAVEHDLSHNHIQISDQITTKSTESKVIEQATQRNKVLKELFDPNNTTARNTMDKAGFKKVKTFDDFVKLKPSLQGRLIRTFTRPMEEKESLETKKKKAFLESDKVKGTVLEHYMTGHADASTQVLGSKLARDYRHYQEELKQRNKDLLADEDKLNVSGIRQLGTGEKLTKFMYTQLFGLRNMINESNADSPLLKINELLKSAHEVDPNINSFRDITDNTLDKDGNNVKAEITKILESWASSLNLSERGIRQLEWIQNYIASITRVDDGNQGCVDQLHFFFSRLLPLIKKYHKTVEHGRDFIDTYDVTDVLSKEKANLSNFKNTLTDFGYYMDLIGIKPDTTNTYAQLYDFNENDYLIKLGETIADDRVKDLLMSRMGEIMLNMYSNMGSVLDHDKGAFAKKLFKFLSKAIPRAAADGHTSTVLEWLLNHENPPKEVKGFLKQLVDAHITESAEGEKKLQDMFRTLRKDPKTKHIFDKTILFLIQQKPVLELLGLDQNALKDAQKNKNEEDNPFLGSKTPLENLTTLLPTIEKLAEKVFPKGKKNSKEAVLNQMALKFELLNNLCNKGIISQAAAQEQLIKLTVKNLFRDGTRILSTNSVEEMLFDYLKLPEKDHPENVTFNTLLKDYLSDPNSIFKSSELRKFYGSKGYVRMPTYEQIRKSVRDARSSLTDVQAEKDRLAEYLAANFGDVLMMSKAFEVDKALEGKPSAKEVQKQFQEFTAAISHMATIANYNTSSVIDVENITEGKYEELLEICSNYTVDGKPGVKRSDFAKVLEDFPDMAGRKDALLDMIFNKKGYIYRDSHRDMEINQEDKLLLTKALATYINRNLYDATNNKTGIKNAYRNEDVVAERVNTKVHGKNMISAVHHHNKHYTEHPDEVFRQKHRGCILGTQDGLEEFLSNNANSEIASNARMLAGMIRDLTEKLRRNLKCSDDERRIVDRFESVNGEFNPFYLQIVAAVALSQLTTLSPEVTNDYYAELVKRHGTAFARTFKDNHCSDWDTAVEAMGTAIARALGYSADSALFYDIATECGQHALMALKIGGFVDLARVSKTTGSFLKEQEAHGKGLADSVRTIHILDKGMDTAPVISKASIFHDVNGSHTILGQLTGRDLNDDTCPLQEQARQERQNSIRELFEEDMGKGLLKDTGVEKGKVIWDHDEDIIAVNIGDENTSKWYFMKGKAVLKTDRVELTDERLYQLALKSDKAKLMDNVATWNFFKPLFDENGNLRYTEEDVINIDKICEENPEIAYLISYNESEKNYGDTSNLQGDFTQNLHIKNMENFRKVLKDARYLAATHADTLKNQQGFGTGYTKLYYDEINTVNNRAFVSSIIFNYREYSPYRKLVDMNDETTFSLHRDFTSAADRVYPILFSLGLKHDKLDLTDYNGDDNVAVRDVWNKLISMENPDTKGSLFIELLDKIAQAHQSDDTFDIKAIKGAIKAFNEAVKKKAAIDDTSKNACSYAIVKPELDGGAKSSKVFSIADNMESVTSLINMLRLKYEYRDESKPNNQAKNGDFLSSFTKQGQDAYFHKQFLLKEIAGLDNISLSNYKIRVEIDGLTNGPSIKEIADSMHLRNGKFSRLIVNGVGLNPKYMSIMATQLQEHTLDTYLLNSAVAQYDLNIKEAQNLIRNGYRENEALKYLKALYKLDDANLGNGFVDVMANILSRDMMKKPVMVVGYEAGKVSVLQKMAFQFDLQASRLLFDGDQAALKKWLDLATHLNGGSLTIRILTDKGMTETATLDKEGNISGRGSILTDKDLRMKVCFSTIENQALTENLNSMLGSLYDSMADVMKKPQTPFDMNNEASQAMAETINAVVHYHMQEYFDKHKNGINWFNFRDDLFQEVEKLTNKICTIFPVGNSKLQTIKRAVAADLQTYLSSMTLSKDGSIFIKTNYKLGHYDALGAGEVPMIIHSYDSEIVHAVQQLFTEATGREILAVHDAIIVGPSEVMNAYECNRNWYNIGHISKATFVARDNAMLKTINNLKNMRDLPVELRNQLINRMQSIYNHTSAYTVSLIQDQLDFYTDQLAKNFNDREVYNQYALGALTGYRPTDKDLERGIEFLQKQLDSMTSNELYVNKAVEVLPKVLNAYIEAHIPQELWARIKSEFFNPKSLNILKSGLLKGSEATLTEIVNHLHKMLENRRDLKQYSKTKITLNRGELLRDVRTAVNGVINQDPYVQILRNINHGYNINRAASQKNATWFKNKVLPVLEKYAQDKGIDISRINPPFTATNLDTLTEDEIITQIVEHSNKSNTGIDAETLRKDLNAQKKPKKIEFTTKDFHKELPLGEGTMATAINQIYQMFEVLNTNYHPDDDREIRMQIQAALIKVLRMKPGKTLTIQDKLNILQEVSGNRLSGNQETAYNNLVESLDSLHQFDHSNAELDDYDTSKPITLDMSDDLDYQAIESKHERDYNRDLINKDTSKSKRDRAVSWFERTVIESVKQEYQGKDVQVGFCLHTKMDILRFRALTHLKAQYPTLFKDVKIVLVPNVGNINKYCHRVSSRALGQYTAIYKAHSGQVNVVYNMAPGSNRELVSTIINKGVNKAEIVDKTKPDDDPHIYVPADTMAEDSYEPRSKYEAKVFKVNKLNEMGVSRGAYAKDAAGNITGELDAYMLRDSGIRAEQANKYDYESVAKKKDSEIQADVTDENRFTRTRPVVEGNVLGQGSFIGAVTREEASALCLSVTSNGDLVDNIPYSMVQNIPMFSQAMSEFQTSRIEDLERYNRNEITWEEYLRPRLVSVDIGSGKRKTFMFQVTQDVSFTREELDRAVELKVNNHNGKSYANQVIADTHFSNALNTKYRNNPGMTYAWSSKYGTDDTINKAKRVPVPLHMLDKSRMQGISSEELNRRNACYFEKVNENFQNHGINKVYFIQNNIAYQPVMPVGFNAAWMNVGDMSTHSMSSVAQQIQQSITGNVFTKGWSAVQRLFQGIKRDYRPVESREHSYSGHSDTGFPTVGNLVKQTLNSQTGIHQAIEMVMREDAANGVDTSHLTPIVGAMESLITNAILYIDHANTSVRGSMERFVQEPGRTREEIYLAWGRPTESKTEAFLHELCHTIFNHLPKDSTAYKQAVDLFNYVANNFKIENFEDGDTLENRAIMDAIFSAKTQDNVAEFLVYAMTNKKFQRAMANMKLPANVRSALEARTTGVFNRLVNTLGKWFNGTANEEKVPEYVFPVVQGLFNTAVAMNNSYWNERNALNDQELRLQGIAQIKNYDKQDNSMLAKALSAVPGDLAECIRHYLNIGAKHDYFDTNNVAENYPGEFQEVAPSNNFVTDDYMAQLLTRVRQHMPTLKDGFVNDLLATLEGASKSQFPYLEMRMKGKHAIDWYRNQAITAVNERVKEILKDYPAKYETKLTDYYVRADISSLFNSTLDENQVKELLTNSKARAERIKSLEEQVRREKFGNFFINAAKGLGQYLSTGFNPTGLAYRNAYEIVSMAGSSYQTLTNHNGPTVNAVDQLATLYAVDTLSAKDPKVYEALTPKMLKELSVIHNGIKATELEEVYGESLQKYHVPKGELHGGKVQGRYDIIPESHLKAYEWNGYQKVRDARLDPFYKGVAQNKGTKYVIVAAHNKNPVPVVAGCTVMTDIFKGRAKSGLSFNHENDMDKDITFTETQDWQRLHRYVNSRIEALNKPNPQLLQNETDGNLVLNFNYLGELNGANFELNPLVTDFQIGRNTKMSSVLGDLFGSIQERKQAPEFNQKIAEATLEIYENAKDPENFVWISENSENQDYRDFWDALPYDTKQVITNHPSYKDRGLPVRRKSLNTFFGYRHISSNDTQALMKEIQEENINMNVLGASFTGAIKGMFYNKWVGKAEQFLKWMASTGKENIVIKGITTSWYNVVSNCVTLGLNGLSTKESVKYQVDAIKQIKTLDDINADLQKLHIKRIEGNYTNEDAIREKNLLNAAKALPIYPLVESGIVANTLSANLDDSDRMTKDTIDRVVPKGLPRDIAHAALLTPESYMYKLLSDFASLGDTTGKYAFFKHLTSKGVTEKEAMRQAANMFIDYSNPLPKEIQYADDLGVLPFIKFAIGIQTTILNTVVKHPDRSLGWIMANSALGAHVPDIFSSMLGLSTLNNKIQLPGMLFLDSISQLPSIRITNTLMDSID